MNGGHSIFPSRSLAFGINSTESTNFLLCQFHSERLMFKQHLIVCALPRVASLAYFLSST